MADKNFQELPYTSPPEQRTWSTEVPSRTSTASQIGHGIRAAAAAAVAAAAAAVVEHCVQAGNSWW